jgi:tetratricopeptide (TPR) repeat protein
VALRGLELFLLPGSADALPLLDSSLATGIVVLVAAMAGLALLYGRPILGAFLVPLPLLLPSVAASAGAGVVADRYFYVAFAGFAVALGLGGSLLLARMPRAAALAGLLIPVLALGTWVRADDWTSDQLLFNASLERNSRNPYAAFRVGHDIHVREGDCRRALPLYEMSQDAVPRAGNNLQACLLSLGRVEAAVAMGPRLLERDPIRATPATNTARGLLTLGRPKEAEYWARLALQRSGRRSTALSLLGASLGRQGRHREAFEVFQNALELDPEDRNARVGIKVAGTRLRELESNRSQ